MKSLLTLIMLSTMVAFSGCNKDDEKNNSGGGERVVVNGNSSVRKEIFNGVTSEHGALVVREGQFSSESKIVPWSSWWFPSNRRYMFDRSELDLLAPLQKYDLFAERTHGTDPGSAQFEEKYIYNPSEVAWAGLCHAWAVASVLHVEPTTSYALKGINFTTGDQKALLLKSYENVSDLKIYGQRYDGNRLDEYDDVYPDQFHRVVQVYLFEQKLPFLMDYDPSFSVWTVPVFLTKFSIKKDGANSAFVQAWVTMASPFVDSPDFIGIKRIVKTYEYRLTGEWIDGELKVSGGEWLNDSSFDHPDYIIGFPKDAKRASLNSKLNSTVIDEIVGKKAPRHGIR